MVRDGDNLHAKDGKAENGDQEFPERSQGNLSGFPSQQKLAEHCCGPPAKPGCLGHLGLGNLHATATAQAVEKVPQQPVAYIR
jgi:hypothetical protein